MDVMKYFEMPVAVFRAEWAKLSDPDKEQLKAGLADGTLTY